MLIAPVSRLPAIRRTPLTPVVLARAVEEVEAPSRSFRASERAPYDPERFSLHGRETGLFIDILV